MTSMNHASVNNGEPARSALASVETTDLSTDKSFLADLAPHILVVDDEPMICHQLQRLYARSGYTVELATTAEQALSRLEKRDIDLVVTDVRLPGMSGVELTMKIHEIYPDVPVIVITGYAAIEHAVEVLKRGASDYIVKPFSAKTIQESTDVVLKKARVFIEIRNLRRSLNGGCEFGGMLSRTPEMLQVFETIRMVSPTDMTVLVEGETGTGKELVARAIHFQSARRDAPFVTINCAGLPETLLESELFGYERGAFTGADRSTAGKIELAQGGTLFLDEIESMSLNMQSKLLRVLEDQKIQRLGGSRNIHIDMRVIAASNVPLERLVAEKQMRNDFYYRVSVIPIHIVPLRQRCQDIPLLVADFLHQHPLAAQKGITGVSRRAMERLIQYPWPGNVRELQNVIEKALVLTKSRVIENVELPRSLIPSRQDGNVTSASFPLSHWLKEQEKQYLIRQLEFFGGRINLTARSSGVGVRTLCRKMGVYGLDKKYFKQNGAQTSSFYGNIAKH
jgi:DNA-binding NtrC family response regulator